MLLLVPARSLAMQGVLLINRNARVPCGVGAFWVGEKGYRVRRQKQRRGRRRGRGEAFIREGRARTCGSIGQGAAREPVGEGELAFSGRAS